MILDVEVADEGSFCRCRYKEEYRRLLQLEGSRGQGYPDGEALKWLLETSQMPDHLRRHSEAVSRKALSMAVKLQEKGILLDLNLVRSASLLHDIRKGSADHAATGAALLKGKRLQPGSGDCTAAPLAGQDALKGRRNPGCIFSR